MAKKPKPQPRIYKRGNRWGYYQRWIDKKGIKRKRWYKVQYAGKFREDLPALIKKGYSGTKALSHLRKTKKYHLCTQTFYDIYREHKRAAERKPDIEKLKSDVPIPEELIVPSSLNLQTKYMLFIDYDVLDNKGNIVDTYTFSLRLYHLPTKQEAINMVKARIETSLKLGIEAPTNPYRQQVKERRWFYNNYRLTKIWERREKPIKRVKRGQRYAF